MASLVETPVWTPEIYQLEQNDPVLGGPPDLDNDEGFDNAPHQQLANRTAFLKAEVDALVAELANLTNGAPGALDTLQELADALGDDPNFAATITDMLGKASPAGLVAPFAMPTPPDGWLECDGSEINRTSYAALYAALGDVHGDGDGANTFNLPDLRGEFLRGWDNGRGLDVGRAFASGQDATKLSEHVYRETQFTDNGVYLEIQNADSSEAWNMPANFLHAQIFTDGHPGNPRELQAVRSRNVAVMFCVKY